MATKEQDILVDLFRHELAAREAYKDIIPHLEDTDVIDNIKSFLRDHEAHIEHLSKHIEKLTGTKPAEEKDLKGSLLTSYAAIRSITGQEGALKALQTAEHVIYRRYKEALDSNSLTNESIQMIKDHFKDEEKHNNYVDNKLK